MRTGFYCTKPSRSTAPARCSLCERDFFQSPALTGYTVAVVFSCRDEKLSDPVWLTDIALFATQALGYHDTLSLAGNRFPDMKLKLKDMMLSRNKIIMRVF